LLLVKINLMHAKLEGAVSRARSAWVAYACMMIFLLCYLQW